MVPKKHNLNLTTYQKRHLFKKQKIKTIDEVDAAVLKELKEIFKTLTDKRQKGKVIYKI